MQKNRRGWLAVLAGCVLLIGCQGPGSRQTRTPPTSEKTPNLTAAQKADVQFAMARSVEKSGDLAQASAMYQDVLKKDPRRADALDRLAVIHARQEQFGQAVALHKKALAIQPVNADFHCNLGYCYYLQNCWAEAEMQLQKAIELAPNHQRAHNNLGLVLARTERNQKAFAEFRRAGCTEADAHSNLAFALTLANSWAEAKEHYVRARELAPSSPATENGLRVVSAHLKDIEDRGVVRSAGPVMQDIQEAAKPSAPRTVEADGKQSLFTVSTFEPPLTKPLQSQPIQVEGGQTPNAINPAKLLGPVSVNADADVAPMPAPLHGNLAPRLPLPKGNPATSNVVGARKETGFEIVQ